MKGNVTWPALTFLAGLVLGSVLWTSWFWSYAATKTDIERLERRLDTYILRNPKP